jgi:hypothetical protein
MTAKEKAQELLDKMTKQTYEYQEYAGANYTTYEIGYQGGKKCALIAVDEIIEALLMCYSEDHVVDYWKQVRKEIESL